MRFATIAALSLLVVLPAGAVQQRDQTASLTPTCDNDGRATTTNAVVPMGPDFIEALESKPSMEAAARRPRTLDANGNNAAGTVISRKTGARARVGVAYAARFEAYIDDLETTGSRHSLQRKSAESLCLGRSPLLSKEQLVRAETLPRRRL